MKKPALIITTLVLTIVVLSVVKIFVSNRIATSGVVLGKVQEELLSYKLENTILSEKLYTLSSLTNIASKAYDLGYTDSKTDYVLSNQVPVAIKQ
jgi:hypothetical protein